MTEPVLVCPQCGKPVFRQAVWRKPHEQKARYVCEQHQAVIPVLKETQND